MFVNFRFIQPNNRATATKSELFGLFGLFCAATCGKMSYFKGLYEQQARGNDSFSILCESSVNTGAVLKDETCEQEDAWKSKWQSKSSYFEY